MPGIDRRPSGSGGGGTPSGAAGGDLTGTYPNPTLNAPTAAVTLGLGKYVAVGYNGLPTWIDPAATDWADVVANNYGAIQFVQNSSGSSYINLLRGEKVLAQFQATDTGNPLAYRGASWQFAPSSTNGTPVFSGSLSVLPDGSDWIASVLLNSGIGNGKIELFTVTTQTLLYVKGEVGQTDPALAVYNSANTAIFEVAPTGAVGGALPATDDSIKWNGTKYVAYSTTAVPAFSTNAIVLGTSAAAGVATTVIRSDATIVAFDATVPTTQAIGDSAATGSASVAARRDHKHAMPAFSTNAVIFGSSAAAGSAATLMRSDATIAAFDATTPSTQALGDTGTVGTAAFAARRDHKHVMPTAADIYTAAQSVDTVTATTYTYVIGDAGKLKQHSAATAISATIPPNSTTAYAIGTHIDVAQVNLGQVTFTTATGVTMISNPAVPHTTTSAVASLIKVASDTWIVAGYIV